jgi:hypothetical protein
MRRRYRKSNNSVTIISYFFASALFSRVRIDFSVVIKAVFDGGSPATNAGGHFCQL